MQILLSYLDTLGNGHGPELFHLLAVRKRGLQSGTDLRLLADHIDDLMFCFRQWLATLTQDGLEQVIFLAQQP